MLEILIDEKKGSDKNRFLVDSDNFYVTWREREINLIEFDLKSYEGVQLERVILYSICDVNSSYI